MHQVGTRLVVFKQIKMCTKRAWRVSGLYDRFEGMVFREIQRCIRSGGYYDLVWQIALGGGRSEGRNQGSGEGWRESVY
jgi:hypothetical protein